MTKRKPMNKTESRKLFQSVFSDTCRLVYIMQGDVFGRRTADAFMVKCIVSSCLERNNIRRDYIRCFLKLNNVSTLTNQIRQRENLIDQDAQFRRIDKEILERYG